MLGKPGQVILTRLVSGHTHVLNQCAKCHRLRRDRPLPNMHFRVTIGKHHARPFAMQTAGKLREGGSGAVRVRGIHI